MAIYRNHFSGSIKNGNRNHRHKVNLHGKDTGEQGDDGAHVRHDRTVIRGDVRQVGVQEKQLMHKIRSHELVVDNGCVLTEQKLVGSLGPSRSLLEYVTDLLGCLPNG